VKAGSANGGSAPANAPTAPTSTGPASGGIAGAPSTGGGAPQATSDAATLAFMHEIEASMILKTADDELPSSPVFGTDATPD
jgi:hypothetical protein